MCWTTLELFLPSFLLLLQYPQILNENGCIPINIASIGQELFLGLDLEEETRRCRLYYCFEDAHCQARKGERRGDSIASMADC